MGVERRRAGFRLPWSADGEDSGETQAAVTEVAGEPAPVEADAPAAEGSPVDATAAEAPTSGDAAAPTTAEPPTGEPTTVEPMGASEPAEPASSESMTDEAMNASNPASDAAATPGGESDDFLTSLVGAMRGVAETSRDTSLAELRTAIDTRIEQLRTEASEGETDIRRKADTDLEAVGEWERTEIDRVKGEAEAKRTDRRMQLEQQLAAHRTASEQAVESARSSLAQHESELAAFFAQLGEITDPAAFVAAAKRMPRAPELEGPLAAVTGEAPAGSADPRLEALGVGPGAPAPVDDAATEPTTAPEAPAATAVEAATTSNGDSPAPDTQLAARLAQLDERLSSAQQPATPTASAPATSGAETSTAIVVKGLGSFGAITSFKQSLERVEGVRGVTLSLGPTGEFVYRASHAGDFDLSAAIQGLEGPTASIENTDGTLVVTLSRAR